MSVNIVVKVGLLAITNRYEGEEYE